MENYQELDSALKLLAVAMAKLRVIGVLNGKKDLTCQLGEWFVKTIYEGQYASTPNQKHWDIRVGEKLIQVKAHAKDHMNDNRFSRIKYDEQATVDELIAVVFTGRL